MAEQTVTANKRVPDRRGKNACPLGDLVIAFQ